MTELETKYLLVPAAKPGKALRRLLRDLTWAGFYAQPQPTRLIHDVYFDTADQRLHHAGWSLRSRRTNDTAMLTCKQFGMSRNGWFQRQEIEQLSMHEVPSLQTLGDGPVFELLRRYVPIEAPFEPLFAQANRRTAYLLTHPAFPRSSVELVLDRVRIDGETPLRYAEFEGELKQGGTDFLQAFTAVLSTRKHMVRSRISKYHRGLFHSGRCPLPRTQDALPLTPEQPWARLGACYLGEQLQALQIHEPVALEGLLPEGVHQMRVATRRARAVLKAFRPALGPDARTLSRELSWLCNTLGAVRDLDVQLERLAGYRAQVPAKRLEVVEAFGRSQQAEREAVQRELRDALASSRYLRLLEQGQCLQRRLEESAAADARTIRDAAGPLVRAHVRAIRRAGRGISRRSKARDLHRLRIRIKRMRYQLEILSAPYGAELSRAFEALRRMQNRLGEHQDAQVARGELKAYRASQALGPKARKTIDRLITLEAERAKTLRRGLRRNWQRFEKKARRLAGTF
jgi:CHAD domain-containing protein